MKTGGGCEIKKERSAADLREKSNPHELSDGK